MTVFKSTATILFICTIGYILMLNDALSSEICSDNMSPKEMNLLDTLLSQIQEADIRLHPNKFYQAVVTLNNQPFRMHLFFKDQFHHESNTMTVHDHIFDLDSFVLSGAILNHEFDWIQDESGEYQLLHASIGSPNKADSQLNSTSTFGRLCKLRSKKTTSGKFYSMKQGILHDLTIKSDMALTLIRGPYFDRRLLPRVVALRSEATSGSFDRTLLNQEKIRAQFQNLLKNIPKSTWSKLSLCVDSD